MKKNKFSIITLFLCVFSVSSYATCTRITSYQTTNKTAISYTDPDLVVKSWTGATDPAGSIGSLNPIVNVNSDDYQPVGTVLGTGVAKFTESGLESYDPEQVLFRCTADEAGKLKEFYATNGDNQYSGHYIVDPTLNLGETYYTRFNQVGLKLTNSVTGEDYSRYWKSRVLTDLDTDSQGYILVKAKNFSNFIATLYKVSYYSTSANNPSTGGLYSNGSYNYSQPAAYIAFQGGGYSTNIKDGDDSNSVYPGWYNAWPAAFNLYRRAIIRTGGSCTVTNNTPVVNFGSVSANELNSGAYQKRSFYVRFSCDTNATFGTTAGNVAMGFLPSAENIAAARNLKLNASGNASYGITYLLSNGYGTDNTIATGVGVAIYDSNGNKMNLLTNNINSTISTATPPSATTTVYGNNYGWYSATDNATNEGTTNNQTIYSKNFTASFEKLTGQTITNGKFDATMQIIIQIQ